MAADFLVAPRSEATQKCGAAPMTVTISVTAYHTLCRLRRGEERDGAVVERALAWLDCYSIVAKALGSEELRKAGVVVRQMRKAGYNDEVTTSICRALFGSQSEHDLFKAFKLFAREGLRGARFIDMAEFRCMLRLMGEDVDEDRVDDLFDLVDADESGHLDFKEFCVLVRGMNPKPGHEASQALDAFRSTAEGLGSAFESAALETGSTLSALSSAWAANIRGLGPFEMRKVGLALNNLTDAGFRQDVARALCKAVFCGQSDRQLRRVFRLFDVDHSGLIDVGELRRALPLLGEDVQTADELLTSIGISWRRKLNFEEFCALIRAVNLKQESAGSETTQVKLASPGSTAARMSLHWPGSKSYGSGF